MTTTTQHNVSASFRRQHTDHLLLLYKRELDANLDRYGKRDLTFSMEAIRQAYEVATPLAVASLCGLVSFTLGSCRGSSEL